MKCPACSTNHKRTSGMQCACGYRFVFDPKVHGMGDGRLQAMIARISGNGAYAYTPNQLYAEQIRRLPKRPGLLAALGALGLAAAIAAWSWFELGAYMVFVCGPLALLTIVGLALLTKKPMPRTEWDQLIAQVRDAGRLRHLDQMIVRPGLGSAPQAPGEDDVFDYGVERLVVVDQDLYVDLLVRNGFHASERCLVIAESGYPDYIRRHALRYLDERPDLPIFTLHDEPTRPVEPAERVASALRLTPAELGPRTILDVGIAEADVKRMGLLRRHRKHAPQTPVPFDTLSSDTLHNGIAACLAGGVSMAMLSRQYDGSPHTSDFG